MSCCACGAGITFELPPEHPLVGRDYECGTRVRGGERLESVSCLRRQLDTETAKRRSLAAEVEMLAGRAADAEDDLAGGSALALVDAVIAALEVQS